VVLCGALQHANERVHLFKLGVDGRIILEKYVLRVWLDSFSYRKKNGGCYEIYVGNIGFQVVCKTGLTVVGGDVLVVEFRVNLESY
jgi:hypothetical protein